MTQLPLFRDAPDAPSAVVGPHDDPAWLDLNAPQSAIGAAAPERRLYIDMQTLQ